MVGGFDQQELTVRIDDARNHAGEALRQVEQKLHDEPLVLNVLTVKGDAVEMRRDVFEPSRK